MKKLLTATCGLALMAGIAMADPAGCDGDEEMVKFSHVTNSDNDPKGIAAELFAKRVNEEMDGKMCVEVYPNSMLYDDSKVLDAILEGNIQLAAPSLSKFEAFTKAFQIYDLPFMFKNIGAVDEFQHSEAGMKMKASMEDQGLSGLEYWHGGMKQFSASKPLLLPGDAKGLKFRVQPSEVIVAQIEALGATAQPMAFSEVYGALQAGVVDGQENSWANINGQKFYEVQDGVTATNHGVLDYLVVASVDWLGGLDPEIRDQMLTILNEVTVERNAVVNEIGEQALKAIADSGAEIRKLDDTQRQAWVDAMKPVWEQFAGDIGQENIDAVQAINGKH